jgi:chromosome segregation ATPase
MDNKSEQKIELEIEKLRTEIKNSKRTIFSQPSFYSAISTIIVSVIAIFYTIETGFFEKESKILELKKENLIYEINTFENRRDSLLNYVAILRDEKVFLISSNDELQLKIHKLNDFSENLRLEQERLKQQIVIYRDSILKYSADLNLTKKDVEKLNYDRKLIAEKMIELKYAIDNNLEYSEEIEKIYADIQKLLDEYFSDSGSRFLLLFGD